MGKCHLCLLFTVLFLILVSLGLLVTSIVTDFWYEVDGTKSSNSTIQRDYSYTMGMWRKCYKNGIPFSKYKTECCVLIIHNSKFIFSICQIVVVDRYSDKYKLSY